ncbi:MAG TPA: lactonase family protein [Acidobacteriaceae bacterium]|jgi:6-phosphogluconolactonase
MRFERSLGRTTGPVFALAGLLFAVLAGLVPYRLSVFANTAPVKSDYFVYVGTYTGPASKGIYGYRFDAKTGHLTPLGVAAEVVNPSWVVTDPHHRFVYVVTEMSGDHGPNPHQANGFISSFAIDPKTGALRFLNKISSAGGGPCHLVVDKTGKILFVANYGSGNVASFSIKPDGSIGEMTGLDQHSGSSVDALRQRGPHAHAVVLSPDNRFLFVPDLGLDQIFIYRVDTAKGTFTANNPSSVSVKAGLGPRHFTFGVGAKFAYAVCEMGSSVVVFSYDPLKGSLNPVQTISTLPAGFTGEDNSAEIQIDQAGRFLYASNRGNNSITVFAISPQNGTLTKVQVVPTQGNIPRNFVIEPTGKYLIAANQNSNNMVVFSIDPKNGQLTPTSQVLEIPAPVSILFVPM